MPELFDAHFRELLAKVDPGQRIIAMAESMRVGYYKVPEKAKVIKPEAFLKEPFVHVPIPLAAKYAATSQRARSEPKLYNRNIDNLIGELQSHVDRKIGFREQKRLEQNKAELLRIREVRTQQLSRRLHIRYETEKAERQDARNSRMREVDERHNQRISRIINQFQEKPEIETRKTNPLKRTVDLEAADLADGVLAQGDNGPEAAEATHVRQDNMQFDLNSIALPQLQRVRLQQIGRIEQCLAAAESATLSPAGNQQSDKVSTSLQSVTMQDPDARGIEAQDRQAISREDANPHAEPSLAVLTAVQSSTAMELSAAKEDAAEDRATSHQSGEQPAEQMPSEKEQNGQPIRIVVTEASERQMLRDAEARRAAQRADEAQKAESNKPASEEPQAPSDQKVGGADAMKAPPLNPKPRKRINRSFEEFDQFAQQLPQPRFQEVQQPETTTIQSKGVALTDMELGERPADQNDKQLSIPQSLLLSVGPEMEGRPEVTGGTSAVIQSGVVDSVAAEAKQIKVKPLREIALDGVEKEPRRKKVRRKVVPSGEQPVAQEENGSVDNALVQ